MDNKENVIKFNGYFKNQVRELINDPDFATETGKFFGQMAAIAAQHCIRTKRREALIRVLMEDYDSGKIRMTKERIERMNDILCPGKSKKDIEQSYTCSEL